MKARTLDSPVEWMNLTLPVWMDRLAPGWRTRSYGDLLRTSPADWFAAIYPQYFGVTAPTARAGTYPRQHPTGCGCEECCRQECEPDACHCRCCIGDVDFVMYARAGEQRVIPIVVENRRRREKAITVELGPWRLHGGGSAPIETVSVEPKTFTLAPCAEREIAINVRIKAKAAGEGETPDVDCCLVGLADMTLVGCDHRPLRIAVAILPRDCDPFRVTCGCTCC